MSIKLHFKDLPPTTPSSSSRPTPIIILIHGGASSSRMYDDVAPILTQHGYHLIIPDLPGHGSTVANAKSEDQKPSTFSFDLATNSLHDLIQDVKTKHGSSPIVLVGISLGGQVVLDVLRTHPKLAQAAIVSGASIHGPDAVAAWEMPRLPPVTDERWMRILQEDVEAMGMENAKGVQDASFGFAFEDDLGEGTGGFPPTLVVVGERDVAMARRDFEEVVSKVRRGNGRSEGRVLEGAWHNHSIDVPERFAEVVVEWVGKCGL